uniref:Putative secreted protein n=1 Tax=Ixodes ricinus TaxID=34613 RepID=A0A6B0U738_IXORI
MARACVFIYGFVCARACANNQRDQTPCPHRQLWQRCILRIKRNIVTIKAVYEKEECMWCFFATYCIRYYVVPVSKIETAF